MLPGNVPLVLVRIPAGTFAMGAPETERGFYGNESPPHRVTLTSDYYLGKFEVTQRQWAALMGSNPSRFASCGLDCPVESASWNDICGGLTGSSCAPASFIGRLNAHLGTTHFRLPTEAEWEFAARGATTTEFSFAAPPDWNIECGSFPEALPYMWWCGTSGGTANPVGQKLPNQYGVHEMHGSVWEWVGDWYGSFASSPQTDPQGPSSGAAKVTRGGSWRSYALLCRSAIRHHYAPALTDSYIGFRLARSPDPGCPAPASAPTLTASPSSSSSVEVSWGLVSGAMSYTLSRDATAVYHGAALSYADIRLAADTRYCYTVRATNACGDGPTSPPQCVTTPAAPPPTRTPGPRLRRRLSATVSPHPWR